MRPGCSLLPIGFVAMIALGLKLCAMLDPEPPPPAAEAATPSRSIVTLGQGQTIVAPDGTVARELVDWLASDAPGPTLFELGGDEFAPGSAEPTAQSWPRISRLVAMLKAHPDVHIHIVGHSEDSGDPARDLALSTARARTLAAEIVRQGIAASRVGHEGHGAAEPIADNRSQAGRARNRRVALVLSRS